MSDKKVYRAIGLMSGTALDGIDVALIETDGFGYAKVLDSMGFDYTEQDRALLRAVLGRVDYDDEVREAENLLTDLHIKALEKFGHVADVIGFHGQTLFHDPDNARTFQIGGGAKMAREIGVDVVCDFRSNDMENGGQGAPFLPLYHQAKMAASGVELPLCILNIGGVSNVTFIGKNGQILAFDLGPGNALMDDFISQRTGKKFDKNGGLAKIGQLNVGLIEGWMGNDYFGLPAPKSLDRDVWDVSGIEGLSDADGMATLSAFTTLAIARGAELLPQKPQRWFVCGGGRHNGFLMESLCDKLAADVQSVEALGWNGDATEAEGFAYLAVRSLLGEPLSLPSTTGVKTPVTGGVLHRGVGEVKSA